MKWCQENRHTKAFRGQEKTINNQNASATKLYNLSHMYLHGGEGEG